MSRPTIAFTNEGTDDGIQEWWIHLGRERVGDMSRERPTRWHANGVSGLVRDHDAPWSWSCWLDLTTRTRITIPDGSDLRTAKRIVREAIQAAITKTEGGAA